MCESGDVHENMLQRSFAHNNKMLKTTHMYINRRTEKWILLESHGRDTTGQREDTRSRCQRRQTHQKHSVEWRKQIAGESMWMQLYNLQIQPHLRSNCYRKVTKWSRNAKNFKGKMNEFAEQGNCCPGWGKLYGHEEKDRSFLFVWGLIFFNLLPLEKFLSIKHENQTKRTWFNFWDFWVVY